MRGPEGGPEGGYRSCLHPYNNNAIDKVHQVKMYNKIHNFILEFIFLVSWQRNVKFLAHLRHNKQFGTSNPL